MRMIKIGILNDIFNMSNPNVIVKKTKTTIIRRRELLPKEIEYEKQEKEKRKTLSQPAVGKSRAGKNLKYPYF